MLASLYSNKMVKSAKFTLGWIKKKSQQITQPKSAGILSAHHDVTQQLDSRELCWKATDNTWVSLGKMVFLTCFLILLLTADSPDTSYKAKN